MEKEKENSNKPNFIKEKYKSIKNYINSIKYYIELKKKINFHFIIILSVLIVIFYYLFKDAIFSIINNIKSNFNNKYSLQLNLELLYNIPTILFILLSFYFIIFCKNHITSKNINIIDKIIIITMIFSFVCTVAIDTQILLGLFISLITLIVRFILYKKANKSKNDDNIKTLWDICTVNINNEDLENLKIEDSDKIEHDLFGRTPIVDNLYDSITNFKEDSDCFTIGVVGEWGSGKSSIIELTKNKILNKEFKNKFIIIDDFDPWAIKSQDSLILAMYNTIMENLGENIGYFKRKKVQNALINISTNIPYIGKGIGSFFENRIDDYSEYKEIKVDLEEKLKSFDKRLVFILDNLDRMNSNNILFLLTLIGTLFHLPNITYVVAYDNKRMKKIFDNDLIDSKYLEKIINKEIIVPKIHSLDKQYIFSTCLKKCLKFSPFGNDVESNVNDNLIKIVASKFNNIRDFIRFLNFIIYYMNKTYLYLDNYDFLIIRTIEFLDNELYQKIFLNKIIFTNKIENEQNFTKKVNEIFEEFKNSNCYDLLQFLSFKKLEANKTFTNNSISYSNSIFNEIYFENYFSLNKYTQKYREIKDFFDFTDNINYAKIKNLFDKHNNYLEYDFIDSLKTYLLEIQDIKNNSKTLKIKIYILVYFLEKIKNGLFKNYKENFLVKTKKFLVVDYQNNKSYDQIYNILAEQYQMKHIENPEWKAESKRNKLIDDKANSVIDDLEKKYTNKIKEIFYLILKSENFYYLKEFNDKFSIFCNELKKHKEENNKIIDNCISISSNEYLESNEQVEQILQELEVLFQNNIK